MPPTDPYGIWAEAEVWRESGAGRCERCGARSDRDYCDRCLLDIYREEATETSVCLGMVHHACCVARTRGVDPERIEATVRRTLEESDCESDARDFYGRDVLELLLSDEAGREAVASLLLAAGTPDAE